MTLPAHSGLVCTCGWVGMGWDEAKDHIVAIAGSGEVHEVTDPVSLAALARHLEREARTNAP